MRGAIVTARLNVMDDVLILCDRVRETAFAIHVYLGSGHLERIYENALVSRLRKTGLSIEQQCAVGVFDEDGTLLGSYVADIVIERRLLIELKSTAKLGSEHLSQILGYLKATRLEHGLLINFGAQKLEMRKLILSRD
jgi:GxxExxY protein